MFHVMHLNKSGSGMTSKTACGRNILRTQLSTKWESFKNSSEQCEKCATSKQAELNRKNDDKELNAWEPVDDPNAWKAADAAIIKASRN